MKKPQTILNRFYPRWIVDRDGLRRLIQNPDHHGQMMFTEYNDDATAKYSPPPTLREALDRGIPADDAIAFVKEEERKALAREWPYYEGAPTEDPNAVPETPFDEDPPRASFVPDGTFADAETAARLDAGPLMETKAYPCGCSATGVAPIPEYCPEHDGAAPPAGEPLTGQAWVAAGGMPESEPLPELPHETALDLVSEIPTVEPTEDEIEAMFAQPTETAQPTNPPKAPRKPRAPRDKAAE